MNFQELQRISLKNHFRSGLIIPFIALLLTAYASPSSLETPAQISITEELDTQQVYMTTAATQVTIKTTTPSPEIYPAPVEKIIEPAIGYPEPFIPSLTSPQAWQKVDGCAVLSEVTDGISGNVTDLRIAPDGIAWLVGESGVASYKDGKWSVYLDEEA